MQDSSFAKRAFTKIAAVAGTIALSAMPLVASAGGAALTNLQENMASTSVSAGIDSEAQLPELVGNFIGAALGLLGVVLVVLIVYAGFIWMTAQGNDEKIKKAKGMITSAVIGMIIIFAAYAITNFVVDALVASTTTV